VKKAIEKHLRDFLALFFMALVAIGVTAYILSQERFHLPKWVPAIGSDFYKLNVELQTGQAVVPGQGQTINIAGVKVGDVQSVHLRNGVAVVSVNMDKKYAPVYRNAHVLLRPKTGLKDMYLALDPGSKDSGSLPSGGTIRRTASSHARSPVGGWNGRLTLVPAAAPHPSSLMNPVPGNR
jgi:phospholipid/cholesterol/gamma-HCH transport system substrate-binding protein